MKLSHLKQIVDYLQGVEKINAIYRVDDNLIKIVFDRDETLFFSLQKSDAKIFKCDEYKRSKIYQAPFDVMLSKLCNRTEVQSISLLNGDKIMQIALFQNSSYKSNRIILQFEFTGKHTNVILLDNENVVLEALRHIDAQSSYRVVKVGEVLEELIQAPFQAKEYPLEDVKIFLYQTYRQSQILELENLKKQKVFQLNKKLQKLQKLYKNLGNVEELLEEVTILQNRGNLVLANLYAIKPYMTSVELYNFDGELEKIKLPSGLQSVNEISQYFFKRAKKSKQRAKNLHYEYSSLGEKIEYLKHFIQTVNEAEDASAIKLLFPPKKSKKIKRKDTLSDSIELFWIDGYKVMLGKSEKGNIELLQNARAKDIWLHLQARASAHVIIVTDKQNLPMHIIESAAKLCVDFSVFDKGDFLVDYTPRREVKIQEGANVLYNKYKTVQITKGRKNDS